MKIVHVIGYFQPELGYEEFYTAREQVRLGHDVAVVTSDRIFPFSTEIKSALSSAGMDMDSRKRGTGVSELEGIEVHRLPTMFEWFYDFVAVRGMKEALALLKPDIVHAHETIQGASALAAMHKKLGFALVVDHHGYGPSYGESKTAKNKLARLEYKLVRKPIANAAFKRADIIVAVTEETRNFLVDYHKVEADRITVLPLAVDSDTFRFSAAARKQRRSELSLGKNDILFITTGRLDPAKQVELFIEAFGALPADNTMMVIIGSGDRAYESKLKKAVKDVEAAGKSARERIKIIKFMPQHELPGWYSAADVGFWGKASITMIEGMACRLPIIIPELDSVRHLASHENGYLFEEFKVSAIKKCFEDVYGNSAKRAKMAKNSEKAVEREYNYRARTEKLMSIYESCIKQ